MPAGGAGAGGLRLKPRQSRARSGDAPVADPACARLRRYLFHLIIINFYFFFFRGEDRCWHYPSLGCGVPVAPRGGGWSCGWRLEAEGRPVPGGSEGSWGLLGFPEASPKPAGFMQRAARLASPLGPSSHLCCTPLAAPPGEPYSSVPPRAEGPSPSRPPTTSPWGGCGALG